jgi:nucleotide-binding universal stress UspA family protein
VGYAQNGTSAIARIGVAYDASSDSDRALSAAAESAGRLRVPLHLYHAMHAISHAPGADKFRGHVRDFAQRIVDRGLGRLSPDLQATGRVLEGDVAKAVADAADEDGVGLLFAGCRGYGPLREALLGGSSRALLRSARCPVVVIPHTIRP